jgi:hypothetical protein
MKTLMLLMTFLLISCGAPEKKNKVKVSLGAAVGNEIGSLFPGGVKVYAKHRYEPIAVSINPIEKPEIYLENGSWDIAALGWVSPNNMDGNVYCEFKRVELDGNDVEVKLLLDKAKCDMQGFGFQFNPANGSIYTLRVALCRTLQFADRDQDCEYMPDNNVGSIQVILDNYDSRLSKAANIANGGLQSKCIKVGDPGSVIDTSLRIPLGSDMFWPGTIIKKYKDDNCKSLNDYIDTSANNPIPNMHIFKFGLGGPEHTHQEFPALTTVEPHAGQAKEYFSDKVIMSGVAGTPKAIFLRNMFEYAPFSQFQNNCLGLFVLMKLVIKLEQWTTDHMCLI